MSVKDDFKKFEDRINKSLKEFESKSTLQELGDSEAQLVKKRSRLGYGVPKDGGPKAKFEKLADSTVAQRERIKLHSETNPKKSNLTRTGSLLNDLVASVSGREVTIGHTKARNKEIGGFHQTGGGKLPQRRYLGLAKEDLKQIGAQMQDKFNEILNKVFK